MVLFNSPGAGLVPKRLSTAGTVNASLVRVRGRGRVR
jgi:hypothetical protein